MSSHAPATPPRVEITQLVVGDRRDRARLTAVKASDSRRQGNTVVFVQDLSPLEVRFKSSAELRSRELWGVRALETCLFRIPDSGAYVQAVRHPRERNLALLQVVWGREHLDAGRLILGKRDRDVDVVHPPFIDWDRVDKYGSRVYPQAEEVEPFIDAEVVSGPARLVDQLPVRIVDGGRLVGVRLHEFVVVRVRLQSGVSEEIPVHVPHPFGGEATANTDGTRRLTVRERLGEHTYERSQPVRDWGELAQVLHRCRVTPSPDAAWELFLRDAVWEQRDGIGVEKPEQGPHKRMLDLLGQEDPLALKFFGKLHCSRSTDGPPNNKAISLHLRACRGDHHELRRSLRDLMEAVPGIVGNSDLMDETRVVRSLVSHLHRARELVRPKLRVRNSKK